jgi:hypothetical protein
MAYEHSFNPSIYGDPYNAIPSSRRRGNREHDKYRRRPLTVADALASMSERRWNQMARDVFGCEGKYLDLDVVLSKIIETNTVGTYSSPVDFWIDPEGFWKVHVYE